jgi:hypothetical protein
MSKRSLAESNKHLRTAESRHEIIKRAVVSSSAIEGVGKAARTGATAAFKRDSSTGRFLTKREDPKTSKPRR